jgi:hypothetical protein
MPTVDDVKAKVQRILQGNLGRVEIDSDGDFVVRNESAVVFVRVTEGFGDGGVVVRANCPMVADVPVTPELTMWVATEGQNFIIGSVSLDVRENGLGWLHFRQTIIGDDLDESELMGTIIPVALTSNRLDNELRDRFGGTLFGRE